MCNCNKIIIVYGLHIRTCMIQSFIAILYHLSFLLTLVEESSRLMVLPLDIVYHCFPVFRDIIAVLLNIAATWRNINNMNDNWNVGEVNISSLLLKWNSFWLTFISRSEGIAIALALATSDKVRMQFSTFTRWSTERVTKWHCETRNPALNSWTNTGCRVWKNVENIFHFGNVIV